ncbi:putative casparian strip membrane protein [Helianthus annuus]|nr:putative casparian strip membrane protein [Helianthus annuus]
MGISSNPTPVLSLQRKYKRNHIPNYSTPYPSQIFGFRVYSSGSGLIVSTYLILAAGAVTTELAFLAYKGDVTVTWSEACGTYGHFCKQATASIIITFLVVICYILLSLISSYRLFSKYDAPVGYCNKGIEIVDFGN